MRSMADEFARKGNPMLTERERAEMQARTLPARGGARRAKPKNTWIDVIPEKSERPVNAAQEVLKQTMRLLQCEPRRFQEIPDPAPRPLVFVTPPELPALEEREARRAELARLKRAQQIAAHEAEQAHMWRGFELTMTFALDQE